MSARKITFILLLATSVLVACGATPGPQLDDTWTWTNGDWHESSAPSGAHPGWRQDAIFVYDSVAKQVVMFGGQGPSTSCPNVTVCELSETWTWNGHWTQRDLQVAPSSRMAAMAGYDPMRNQLVIFGGSAANADLTDTWAWDGNKWNKRTPTHSPPFSHGPGAMAWDSATKTLVMINHPRPEAASKASTWSWDGTDWTMHEAAGEPPSGILYADDSRGTAMVIGPSGQFSWTGTQWLRVSPLTDRGDAGVAFDPMSATLMSFGSGGCSGSRGNNSQTWVSADDKWVSIHTTTHPLERAGSYLAYDSEIKGLVLYGGYQSQGCSGLT